MVTKKQTILPKYDKILEQMGQNIKKVCKRRKLTMIQVAERADISRSTLHLIELGNSGVSMAYFNVLRVPGLQNDFLKQASDVI